MLTNFQPDATYKLDSKAIEQLKQCNKLQLRVFYVKGCPSCKKTMPVLKRMLQELPEVKVDEVAVRRANKDDKKASRKLGITTYPAIVICKNDLVKGVILRPDWTQIENKILSAYEKEQPFAKYEPSDWYQPDSQTMTQLKQCTNIKLQIFHADWCPDCTYTLPLLKKIVSELENVTVEDVVVDRQKKDKQGLAERCKVVSIPTIVVYRNEIEKGRIVESPAETLEQDILKFYNEPLSYAKYNVSDWYEPDTTQIQYLAKQKGIKVVIYHADWCPDCTYTLPLCKKIFAALPNITVEDVLVDRSKKDAAGLAEKNKITKIPTLLVYKQKAELGRIVESPKTTIETDIADMLRGTEEQKGGKKKLK